MKGTFNRTVVLAALAALGLGGLAKASPLVTLSVLGSSTGTAGSYTSSLTGIAPGTTLYYEVVAQFAAANTSNTNTAKKPNGSTDSINSLPTFTLADNGGLFLSSNLPSTWSGGSGASAGNNGTPAGVVSSWSGSAASVTAIRVIASPGNFVSADSQVVLLTGQFTTAAGTTGITASTDGTTYSGSIKLAASPQAITTASETSTDHLVGYAGLSVSGAAAIVSLVGTAPSGYGNSLGDLHITGANTQYTPDIATFAGTTGGYVQVHSFSPATDKEIYALDVLGATPAQITEILTDVNAVSGLKASTTWTDIGPDARNPLAPLFPADGGTLVYIGADTGVAAAPYLGVNLANDSALSGVTFSGIAVVPEPASLALFGVSAAGLLIRRRRR